MKIQVERTSSTTKKPCPKARCESVTRRDIRYYTKEQLAANKTWADQWHSEGTNHTIRDDGFIYRELPDTCWVIELVNLEQLDRFIGTYGECVVSKSDIKGIALKLEIYDESRE